MLSYDVKFRKTKFYLVTSNFETQNSVTAHTETQILELQILVPSTIQRKALLKRT